MLSIAVLFYCSALSLQGFDVCLIDNARERIAAELAPAAESNPRFFLACRNDPSHGPTPLEDDKLFTGATDLIEQSQTLSLKSGGSDLHKTTVHDQCTARQDLPLADRALYARQGRDNYAIPEGLGAAFARRQRGDAIPVYSH
jgi:hypothetical protein